MKSAKEWLIEQRPTNIPLECNVILADEAVIEAIQLDAMKEKAAMESLKTNLYKQFVEAWLAGSADRTLHSLWHKNIKEKLKSIDENEVKL